VALKFPSDLTDRYYFDLKFVTYSRPNPFSGKINLGSPAIGAAPGSGNLRLPIPAHMVDSQTLKWVQDENLDGLIGASVDFVSGDLAESGANALNQGGRLMEMLSNAARFASYGALGDLMGYTLQKSGLALNPVLTQTFKHPEFKSHQFSWRLAPGTRGETRVLQTIIDTIKHNALPDIAAGGAFFTYPSIAMIQIHTGNNGPLYNFQPCVVQNITVNWAPQGVPSFLVETNGPTMVQIDLTLIEIILNTRSNSGTNAGKNIVGFEGFDLSLGSIGSSVLRNQELATLRKFL
jgi:hypothetical protein